MATLGYSARVGIVVLLALAIFYGLFVFLGYARNESNSYKIHVIFNDASGLAKGVDVTMAGVKIGKIEDIVLNKNVNADLVLSIDKKFTIPVGSKFVVAITPLEN